MLIVNTRYRFFTFYLHEKKPCAFKNKTVAMVLCIFLGYLGCHYFYVGKAGMGVLYLFTMGLFGIGWIVDIIRIAGGSFKDVNGLLLN